MSTKPKLPTPKGRRTPGEVLSSTYRATIKWFQILFDLEKGVDREGTIIAIKNNKRMEGSNAWLLMCSIMIASLGLDLNSPAVIIGAMLISPLMSPILGVGLSVAINDRDALYISIQHFGIAILIALVTSTLYFLITPLGQLTDEIKARTAPTVLDCFVAIFGGLAGIISATRKDKSNAIPGVAIATALMPPLCVTGYGIAKWNMPILLNSFYLFFLNSFFIALTTYIIIRVLRFPLKAYVNEVEQARTRWVITFFSMIIIIPSAIILYNLYLEQQDKIKAEAFINQYFNENDEINTKVIDYTLLREDTTKKIVLQLLGETIPNDSLPLYYEGLKQYGFDDNVQLSLIQDSDLGLDQIENMRLELTGLNQIANQLETVNKAKTETELLLENAQATLDSILQDTIAFMQIQAEVKSAFPPVEQFGYAKLDISDYNTPRKKIPTFLIDWKNGMGRTTKRREQKKLYDYLKVRTSLDTLQIIEY
ncbi:MAG: DUF389 domain-containing protein [Bacteroidota bacterium]